MRSSKQNNFLFRRGLKALGDASGSVTIEAAFVFTLLIVLCFALFDYGLYLDSKARTEAVNHSLMSVLRERTHLYADEDQISQEEVTQLTKVAEVMLGKASKSGFCLTLESMTFKEEEARSPQLTQIYYGGKAGCKQAPPAKITDFQAMSPWSNRQRWVPLYQVTLSLPLPSGNLHTLLSGVGALPERIVVSNIALRR